MPNLKLRKPQLLAACAALTAVCAAQAQTLPAVPSGLLPSTAASAPVAGVPAQLLGAAQVAPRTGTYVVPSVAVLATQTSNATLGTGSPARSDTVLQVLPRLFLQSSHARWRLDGNLGLSGTYYAAGVEPNLVTPDGNARLHSEWVKNLLFVDAGFGASQQSVSPYQGAGGPVQGSRYTTTQWHVAPYIERMLEPGLRLLVRSDDTWTHTSNTPSQSTVSGGRYLDQRLLLERAPTPIGYGLDLRQLYSTYDNEPYAWLRDTTLRASAGVAVAPHLVLSVIAGHEKVQAYTAQQSDTLYGVRAQWRPSPVTHLDATVEHRFFGTGWLLRLHGGGPRARLSLRWSRDATSGLAPLGSGQTAQSNLGTLLDGLLAAQIPDPLQRARMVQQLLGEAGLPAGLQTAGGYYTSSSILRNDLVLTAALLRVRDSFALSLYRSRVQDLFLPGQGVLRLLQLTSNDNVQTGAAFNYGHRLSPLDNLNLTLQDELDSGFGPNQGRSARQRSLIVQIDHRMSPRTTALVGLRRQLLSSTLVLGGTETAVFAGLVHRF